MNQSVSRALDILEALSSGPKRLGDVAGVLGTHKSTALRLLQTLESRGYVRRQSDDREFVLGLRIVELATGLLEDLDLRTVAREHIEMLAGATGETVHLAVLEDSQVVYVDKVESRHPVRMYSRVGLRAPAHCTGVGKVLLAYGSEGEWPRGRLKAYTARTITTRERLRKEAELIRKRGWAMDEREHEESIRCVAAPVFDAGGRRLAGVSISGPASRMSIEELTSNVPLLLKVAQAITSDMGGRWVGAGE